MMLSGGVFTSTAFPDAHAWEAFIRYNATTNVYSSREPQSSDYFMMHALFCYGWWDNPCHAKGGFWLCKNRCVVALLSAWKNTALHAS
jgi:hypothetical protein